MSHLGDSGQNQIPKTKGTAGMKAEPNCKRHAILPTSLTIRFAVVPRKMPKAVQTCHDMTRPPRMLAGEFSAEKTGTVTSLRPIPSPSKILHATSCPQCWVHAEPIGASRLKIAPRKMVPLRPRRLLMGSEIHAALFPRQISIYIYFYRSR
jgi:hypothetical protein